MNANEYEDQNEIKIKMKRKIKIMVKMDTYWMKIDQKEGRSK